MLNMTRKDLFNVQNQVPGILRCGHLVILQNKMLASEICTHLKYVCITNAYVGVSSIDWPPRVCAKVTGKVMVGML